VDASEEVIGEGSRSAAQPSVNPTAAGEPILLSVGEDEMERV